MFETFLKEHYFRVFFGTFFRIFQSQMHFLKEHFLNIFRAFESELHLYYSFFVFTLLCYMSNSLLLCYYYKSLNKYIVFFIIVHQYIICASQPNFVKLLVYKFLYKIILSNEYSHY